MDLSQSGRKIFLDRYALKGNRETLAVGDLVMVLVKPDPKWPQVEEAKVVEIHKETVDVELLTGEEVGCIKTYPIGRIDKLLETNPEQVWERVAKGLSNGSEHLYNLIYWALSNGYFVPAGRILAAAGTDQKLTFYNCNLLPCPKDSRGGIIETLRTMIELMSRGGGVGINISSLRPQYAPVLGVNGRSSGAVSWGGIYSYATGLVSQGGCFAGDVRIATDKGLIPAKELLLRMSNGEVFNALTHIGAKRLVNHFDNGVKLVYKVTTANGFNVKVTSEHRMGVLREGKITTVPLGDLAIGDTVLVSMGGYDNPEYVKLKPVLNVVPDTITNIELIGEENVYDFEVEDVHMLSGNGVYTSNSRRGALLLLLADWHPDIEAFIDAKRIAGKMENANISIGLSTQFEKALVNDDWWNLEFPDTTHPAYESEWDGNLWKWKDKGYPVVVYKQMRARELWRKIIESAWSSAEPGVVRLGYANDMSNSYYYDDIVGVNPCAEQNLPAWGVCNLGHINLGRMIKGKDVDWDMLRATIYIAVEALDNVIDITPYFFDEQKTQAKKERRIGLGTLGLAEMLVRLGIANDGEVPPDTFRYGSKRCLAFIDKLYKFIAETAYTSSILLAAKKGSFPAFDADKFLESGFAKGLPDYIRKVIKKQGIRNTTLLTSAPTGSVGSMMGTSTGIEPYFSWKYYRNSRLGLIEVLEQVAKEWLEEHSGATLHDLPPYFVTAMELTPEEHIRTQAAIQRWIDSAISKTVNMPSDATIDDVDRAYRLAIELGCKGCTVYRDGSRSEQVLTTFEPQQARPNVIMEEDVVNDCPNGSCAI